MAFIGFGLSALLGALAWGAADARLFLRMFLHPQVVAHVHLWLPGFLLSVCIGAYYQLMPVVLGVPLRAKESVLWLHFGLHVGGVLALVSGFIDGNFLMVAGGGGAVVSGILILAIAAARTFLASSRRDAVAWCFPLSAGWLSITVVVGTLLALNRHSLFLPLATVSLLKAHAHLGLAGFFTSLLQGTPFQLVPMFTLGEPRKPAWAWAGLLCTQFGLPVLAVGLAWESPATALAGAGAVTAGIFATIVSLHATLRTRRRRTLEPGLRAFVFGMALLPVAALGGLTLLLSTENGPGLLPWINVYGVALIAGALTYCVLGMGCKIIPFLVWMRAYGPRVGKQPVPVATTLSSHRLEGLWFSLHSLGLGLLLAGIPLDNTALCAAGTLSLLGGGAAFLTNAVRIIRHLFIRITPLQSSRIP